MADYIYGAGLVFPQETMLPVPNQTGIFLDQVGGTERPVTDTQGVAIQVTTNGQGYFPNFLSDVPRGVLMFGSYAHPVISDTVFDQSAQAYSSASTALATASEAKSIADATTAELAGKAAIDHTHDTRYALATHNHNAIYAPLVQPTSTRALSADQLIPNGPSTAILFNVQQIQTGGIIYSGTEWTLPKAGLWDITAVVAYAFVDPATNPMRLREIRIWVNGVERGLVSEDRTAAATVTLPRTLALSTGDKVSIHARQDSGASLAIRANQTWARLQWTGAAS